MIQFSVRNLAVSGAAAVLTACGGGGGGGGGFGELTAADANVVITAGNANQIVRDVNTGASLTDGFIAGLVLGISATSTVVAAAAGEDAPLVVSPNAVQACSNPGGTVDVTEGTNFTDFEFDNCVDFNFEGTLFSGLNDGGLRITVTSAQSLADFVADIEFRDYRNVVAGTDGTLDGSVTVDYFETASQLRVELDTNRLSATVDGEALLVRDYTSIIIATLQNVTQDARGGVSGASLGGLAFRETIDPLVTVSGDMRPTSGNYIIFGADGSRIRVRPQADGINAQISLDLDAIDGFETVYLITWDELLMDNMI